MTSGERPAPDLDLHGRQLGLPGLGPAEQRRLARSTVLVAGIGGLGGAAATYLAAAGVGRLVLVHPGPLELPDLNRQTLMRPADLGTSRVAAAARTLREHHPGLDVVGYDCGLDAPVVSSLVAGSDLVVDARHNFPERHLLVRACQEARVPEVVAAMDGTLVQLLTALPGGPCWRCVFPRADVSWDPLGFRVLGAVSGVAGCLAAAEVVKVLTGAGETLAGRLFYGDVWSMRFTDVPVLRVPDCPGCGGATEPSTARGQGLGSCARAAVSRGGGDRGSGNR